MPIKRFAKHSPLYKEIYCNGIQIYAMVADTCESRQKGLSGVADLPANHGMLFDFGEEQFTTFHMRGCLQDLSIAFITKHGVIADIQEMTFNNPAKLYRSPLPVRYALEANPGFFVQNHIIPGDKIFF